jgi:hypothetical protein
MIPLGCAKNRELANKKFTVVSAECGRESNVSSEKMNGWMALVRQGPQIGEASSGPFLETIESVESVPQKIMTVSTSSSIALL